MTDYLFDVPDDEEDKPAEESAELTEQQERDKRYAEEAAQKLTRGGGLDEPLDKLNRTRVLIAAGAVVSLIAGGVAWARASAKNTEPVAERMTLRQDDRRLKPPPEFEKLGAPTPQVGDAYDNVDPKDPAFTTPVAITPVAGDPEMDCPAEYTTEQCAKMQGGGECPDWYSAERCKNFLARQAGHGGSELKSRTPPGYAANTHKPTDDFETEDSRMLAPLGYFGTSRNQTPVSVARQPAIDEMPPMATMPGQGLSLPPNLRQALEKAAEGQGQSDPDDVKEAFAARPGVLDAADTTRPMGRCELTAGTVIHVANLSAINTDIPAKAAVTAMVTSTVYCGSDDQYVAIPQGSKLTGSANARVSYGDERIQVCMEQIERPASQQNPTKDITSLGCWAAADITGMVGWTGEVDNHWSQLIAGVALSTFLSLGTTASTGNQEGFAPTIAQRAASNAGQQFNQAGQRIVQRDLQRKPTITRSMLQSGTVVVTENKPLTPWKARKARRRDW